MKPTGYYDKNNKEIFDGQILIGKNIDGNIAEFVVKWSDYRKCFIGYNSDEMYDISPSIFYQYTIQINNS